MTDDKSDQRIDITQGPRTRPVEKRIPSLPDSSTRIEERKNPDPRPTIKDTPNPSKNNDLT